MKILLAIETIENIRKWLLSLWYISYCYPQQSQVEPNMSRLVANNKEKLTPCRNDYTDASSESKSENGITVNNNTQNIMNAYVNG